MAKISINIDTEITCRCGNKLKITHTDYNPAELITELKDVGFILKEDTGKDITPGNHIFHVEKCEKCYAVNRMGKQTVLHIEKEPERTFDFEMFCECGQKLEQKTFESKFSYTPDPLNPTLNFPTTILDADGFPTTKASPPIEKIHTDTQFILKKCFKCQLNHNTEMKKQKDFKDAHRMSLQGYRAELENIANAIEKDIDTL